MIKIEQKSLSEHQMPLVEQDIVVRHRSFSLSEGDIAVYHEVPLQIRSGVRSGDQESCEAEGGTYNCADWGCHCTDSGTGDWD